MPIVPDEGHGLNLPGTMEVNPLDKRTPAQFVVDKIQEIMGPNVWVGLAGQNPNKPQRIADLARFGIIPIRWSELAAKKAKELRRIIPYAPDDLVRYGDTVVVVATQEAHQARLRYKEAQRTQAMRRQVESESPESLSRELGLKVTSDV
jgi:hypothetical protein